METEYKWSNKDIPHTGWRSTGEVTDLGEGNSTRCRMCNNPNVRFVHTMYHDELGATLEVGCVCAEHLDANYDGEAAEMKVRKASSEISKKMKTIEKDNLTVKFRKIKKDLVAVVYENGRWYWVSEHESDTYDSRNVKRFFDTDDEARNDLVDTYRTAGWL